MNTLQYEAFQAPELLLARPDLFSERHQSPKSFRACLRSSMLDVQAPDMRITSSSKMLWRHTLLHCEPIAESLLR